MISRPPTSRDQIRFLQQLQRILSDGTFVATYKYALLHSLADLAVIHGDDSGGELTISAPQIAEQVIELYWRQAAPFVTPEQQPVVLRQNTGGQAAILRHLQQAMEEIEPSLTNLRQRGEDWNQLVTRVDVVVRRMPLWKLQTVGQERLDFLYENRDSGTEVTLKPGVAFSLRAFYDLILDLIRGAWLRFVRNQNASLLGDVGDLSSFLFGTERASLSLYQPILAEVQNGKCFYCGRGLGRGADVDHFIPWSRYPMDLGHNLVLAHGTCNRNKSDHIPAEMHLERWLERNASHAGMLSAGFREAGVLFDASASEGVALWAYGHTERIGGSVWVQGRKLVELSGTWKHLLSVVPSVRPDGHRQA